MLKQLSHPGAPTPVFIAQHSSSGLPFSWTKMTIMPSAPWKRFSQLGQLSFSNFPGNHAKPWFPFTSPWLGLNQVAAPDRQWYVQLRIIFLLQRQKNRWHGSGSPNLLSQQFVKGSCCETSNRLKVPMVPGDHLHKCMVPGDHLHSVRHEWRFLEKYKGRI